VKEVRFVPITALTVALAFAGVALPQTVSKDTSKPAANAWMLTPTPYLAWNQDIPALVRAQRDRFWDEAAPQRVPLTAPGAEEMSVNTGEDGRGLDEIRNFPNRVILTGAFTKHRSVLSASEYSLYTEVTLHVDAVFDDRSGSGHPFAGKDVTLLLSGGTVTLQSGRILTHNTSPRELFLQLGHEYLLVLQYHGDGDFYQYTDDWDISDGTARANSPGVRYLAQTGHSSLNGLTVQQLGPALGKLLYGHQ
jgi:hypothetical protein